MIEFPYGKFIICARDRRKGQPGPELPEAG